MNIFSHNIPTSRFPKEKIYDRQQQSRHIERAIQQIERVLPAMPPACQDEAQRIISMLLKIHPNDESQLEMACKISKVMSVAPQLAGIIQINPAPNQPKQYLVGTVEIKLAQVLEQLKVINNHAPDQPCRYPYGSIGLEAVMQEIQALQSILSKLAGHHMGQESWEDCVNRTLHLLGDMYARELPQGIENQPLSSNQLVLICTFARQEWEADNVTGTSPINDIRQLPIACAAMIDLKAMKLDDLPLATSLMTALRTIHSGDGELSYEQKWLIGELPSHIEQLSGRLQVSIDNQTLQQAIQLAGQNVIGSDTVRKGIERTLQRPEIQQGQKRLREILEMPPSEAMLELQADMD